MGSLHDLVVKSFLYAFNGSNCLYELKGNLNPVMLKEIFHDSVENFEITRICMENHARVTGRQKLFFTNKCFQFLVAVAITNLRYTTENSQVSLF